jgi:ATP-binding cassette subfamily B protein
MTQGQVIALYNYMSQILVELIKLANLIISITRALASATRISDVFDMPSSEAVGTITELPAGDIAVEFKSAALKYRGAGEDSLSPISFVAKAGDTVGIIGGTGSAKTTMVQLIPRLYDVSEGVIRVGGVDVRDYGISTIREAVGMVLQKNLLFSGTIKENLRWGNESATDEELIEACRLAEAHSFVSAFPDGYDTHIEQGGTNVSGGQKQRLCIARALLKKPKILILDDSTSAVDTKTDAIIRQRLTTYIPETTKIIIAQRISSVMDADIIIVLDGGKISAIGNHKQLMESSLIYREVYEQQTEGSEKREDV